MNSLQKMLAPLRQRVMSTVGRFVLEAVDDARRMQTVSGTILAGERLANLEHFQAYGFSSHAQAGGAEGIALAVGGNRDHTLVVCIDDRRYRIQSLAPGEVSMYDDLGQVVTLKRDRIEITSPALVHVTAPLLKVTGDVRIEGELRVVDDILDHVDASPKSLQGLRDVYNVHVHPENGNSGPTDEPNQQA